MHIADTCTGKTHLKILNPAGNSLAAASQGSAHATCCQNKCWFTPLFARSRTTASPCRVVPARCRCSLLQRVQSCGQGRLNPLLGVKDAEFSSEWGTCRAAALSSSSVWRCGEETFALRYFCFSDWFIFSFICSLGLRAGNSWGLFC